MSQAIQGHRRSHSDNSQDSQTKKLESFMYLLQELCQHDAFKNAAKVAKEMADLKAESKQREDSISGLEKNLQAEKKASAEKIRDMEKYFADKIFSSHLQEIANRESQVDAARDDLKTAEAQISEYKKASAELANAKRQLETQEQELEQERKKVQDLRKKQIEQDTQIQRDKNKVTQLEVSIKNLESDKERFKQYQSELQKLQGFSAVLVDDDLPEV